MVHDLLIRLSGNRLPATMVWTVGLSASKIEVLCYPSTVFCALLVMSSPTFQIAPACAADLTPPHSSRAPANETRGDNRGAGRRQQKLICAACLSHK